MAGGGRRLGLTARNRLLAGAMLAPAALICISAIGWAFVLEVRFSLSSAGPGTDGAFVGLANFQFLAGLAGFWQMLANTAIFSGAGTLLKLSLGLVMALALARPFFGRRLVAAALFLPFIFPIVLGTIAWYFLLTNVHGGINSILAAAHLIAAPIDWKGRLPMVSVVGVSVWHGTALFGVLLLAGLQSVPKDVLDAAAVDGAGRASRFAHIVVPHLVPAALLGVVLSVLGNFGDFAIVELLTRGGPLGQSQIVSTFAFENALVSGYVGLGAAVALVMVPVYFLALVLTLRLLGRE